VKNLQNDGYPVETKINKEYEGKTCVITGATGIIGTTLCYSLLKSGANVFAITRGESDKPLWRQLELLWQYHRKDFPDNAFLGIITMDLRSEHSIKALADLIPEPDYVFHLAAIIGGFLTNSECPASILCDNTRLTMNIYEYVLVLSKIPRMVIFSSAMIYERYNERFPQERYYEKFALNVPPPRLPYSFQKLFNEYYANAIFDQYEIPFTIIRTLNVYGPGEMFERKFGYAHLIPDLIEKIRRALKENRKSITLFGNGQDTQPYTWVGDIVEATLLAAKLSHNQAFNVNSSTYLSVNYVAEKLLEIMDPLSYLVINYNAISDYKPKVRKPSADKICKCGWYASHDFKEGLRQTILWHMDQWKEDDIPPQLRSLQVESES
jgi:nucleoside-diphosphate-sugar epimerase